MAGLSLTPGMPVEKADEGEAHVSALPAVTEDGSEVAGTAAEESAALEDLAQVTKDDGTDAVEEEEAAMPESTLPVSKPAEETTAGEPPVQASEQALAAPMTTCIRRAGCTCVDCAEMAGIWRMYVLRFHRQKTSRRRRVRSPRTRLTSKTQSSRLQRRSKRQTHLPLRCRRRSRKRSQREINRMLSQTFLAIRRQT
jgi:hypothetical protein